MKPMAKHSEEQMLSDINYRQTATVLAALAKQFAKTSQQYRALVLAGKALHYVYTSGSHRSFNKYLRTFSAPLTTKQKEHLKRLGIDVNHCKGSRASNSKSLIRGK